MENEVFGSDMDEKHRYYPYNDAKALVAKEYSVQHDDVDDVVDEN